MKDQNKTILSFEDVHTGYGDREIIRGFTAAFDAGEFVGIIGSNGTGKSTLLKCLSGIIPVTGGKITIEGRDNASLTQRERSRKVAVVPQSFAIDYDFLVEDMVMMGRNPYLGYKDRESTEDWKIVDHAMNISDTKKFRGRLFNELSGGEKQRVIIARAIAQQPDILLLDEPTSALDVHHQIEVMEMIETLNREAQMTVVAVLHDLNLAARYCRRLVMLYNGRVVADGTPKEVIVEHNMELLYDMKMLIRQNAVFEKPEIVPLRVLDHQPAANPLHVHVICGGAGACKVLDELKSLGHRVTAGVVNQGSDDWLMCKDLGIDRVEVAPFTTIRWEDQKKNLNLMADADVILVADVPFGNGNIENLTGLETLNGALYVHQSVVYNDYTGGGVQRRLDAIAKKHTLHYVSDHDEFLEAVRNLPEKGKLSATSQ